MLHFLKGRIHDWWANVAGKNYHYVHPTADVASVINGTIRSAFEYSGQKCSAVSRMYVPESLWPQVWSHDLYVSIM